MPLASSDRAGDPAIILRPDSDGAAQPILELEAPLFPGKTLKFGVEAQLFVSTGGINWAWRERSLVQPSVEPTRTLAAHRPPAAKRRKEGRAFQKTRGGGWHPVGIRFGLQGTRSKGGHNTPALRRYSSSA